MLKMDDVIRVGIGVFIIKNQRDVLMGRRKNAHGDGEWAFPGGKQEHGEGIFQGAARELQEECGPELKVCDMRILCNGDLTKYSPKHFFEVGIACSYVSGEAVVMEPDKCYEWQWFNMWNLPKNHFASAPHYVLAHTTGKFYWKA